MGYHAGAWEPEIDFCLCLKVSVKLGEVQSDPLSSIKSPLINPIGYELTACVE